MQVLCSVRDPPGPPQRGPPRPAGAESVAVKGSKQERPNRNGRAKTELAETEGAAPHDVGLVANGNVAPTAGTCTTTSAKGGEEDNVAPPPPEGGARGPTHAAHVGPPAVDTDKGPDRDKVCRPLRICDAFA